MPSTLYLSTGDEFTVSQPYAVALDMWATRSDAAWLAEFTMVYWRDPRFLDEDDEWPAYREAKVTVDLTSVMAVERIEGPQAAAIERARQFQSGRSDLN